MNFLKLLFRREESQMQSCSLNDPVLQTSLDPGDWKENNLHESRRFALAHNSPPEEIRHLFPLSARVVAVGMGQGQLIQKGQILRWVRTKRVAAAYPIEAIIFDGAIKRWVSLRKDEVELLPPQD